MDKALFEVKNRTGQTVFAVYNEGVRVYVDNGVTKGAKGGFAVGGFSKTKGPVVPFVDLTPKNYFIGHESGQGITTGLYNSFFGYQAGKSNKDGAYNIFIGYQAGFSNLGPPSPEWVGGQYGSFNCYMGYQAGYSSINGAHNTFIGYASGNSNTSDNNTFVGSMSGSQNTGGGNNTFIGTQAGNRNKTGNDNVFLGRWAGWNDLTGNSNTLIGTYAGADLNSGSANVIIGAGAMADQFYGGTGTASSNVIIGYDAGKKGLYSSSNILIGYQSGYNETGSDKLYIENSDKDSNNALIYGEFNNDIIRLNGTVNIRDVLKLKPRATAPANPSEGDIYYDSSTHKLMVHNGTTWMACW